MEKLYPEPSIHPDDTVGDFVSTLIEEFGDKWGPVGAAENTKRRKKPWKSQNTRRLSLSAPARA
jgi:hypothetical protein